MQIEELDRVIAAELSLPTADAVQVRHRQLIFALCH